MPELAELRLTADYINNRVNGLRFESVDKNPQHKCEDLEIPFKHFKIKAQSRGKEIVVSILDCYSDNSIPIRITMGMSGYFSMTNTGKEANHSHLKFNTTDGTTLSFVDVRRFGKWKQGVNWNTTRGPDPTTEFEKFKENVSKNIDKASFSKPIYETLMDQKYFNGIGNYLRAEILYRIPTLNPNTNGRDALESYPIIFELCRDIPMMAYQKGGGSIKDWKNPFPNESSERFFLCYGVKGMAQRIDRNGRRFWFDSKWL